MKKTTAMFCLIIALYSGIVSAQPEIRTDSTSKKNENKKIDIGGVIQVHYMTELNTNGDTIRDPGGFRILRARLIASGDLNKYISYQLMIDPRAPELGGVLRDAYMDFHLIKNQTIRLGQQKTQFGWENRESITELYTVNRAEMSDGASRGENLRDIGIGLLGHIKLNPQWRVENAITFTNGTKMNVTGPYDFNTKKALWGRVGVRYKKDDLIFRLGASVGAGGLRYLGDDIVDPADDVYADFNRIGTDMEIDQKHFFLAAEYAVGEDIAGDTLFEDPMGYQVLLAIKTKWKAGPVIRYDVFQDEWSVWTFGAYYGDPKDKFRILFNYISRGNVIDIPKGHDDRMYLQAQIKF